MRSLSALLPDPTDERHVVAASRAGLQTGCLRCSRFPLSDGAIRWQGTDQTGFHQPPSVFPRSSRTEYQITGTPDRRVPGQAAPVAGRARVFAYPPPHPAAPPPGSQATRRRATRRRPPVPCPPLAPAGPWENRVQAQGGPPATGPARRAKPLDQDQGPPPRRRVEKACQRRDFVSCRRRP